MVCFSSSLLLAVFFGAALADVIRGVPLRADGYFFSWTNWRVGPEPGILDWVPSSAEWSLWWLSPPTVRFIWP